MKILLVACIVAFVSVSTSAAEQPSRESMVASALDEYGKVAGAWFLNQRCKYIDGDENKSFEDNVALITGALGRDLGGPQMLYMVQGGAKEATSKPKYEDCEGVAKEFFTYGKNHAQNWSDQIRKLQGK